MVFILTILHTQFGGLKFHPIKSHSHTLSLLLSLHHHLGLNPLALPLATNYKCVFGYPYGEVTFFFQLDSYKSKIG